MMQITGRKTAQQIFGGHPLKAVCSRGLAVLAGFIMLLALSTPARAMDFETFLRKQRAGERITLIDIRPATTFAEGHIPNAINIPASILPRKRLPPMGQVLVYGDGIDAGALQQALAALNQKPGIQASALDGGYAAWLASGKVVQPKQKKLLLDSTRQLTYQQFMALLRDDHGVVLVDLRQTRSTPLATLLPGRLPGVETVIDDLRAPVQRSLIQAIKQYSAKAHQHVFVLIDAGEGVAQDMAKALHAAGIKRVAILAGGVIALQAKGKTGEAVEVYGNR